MKHGEMSKVSFAPLSAFTPHHITHAAAHSYTAAVVIVVVALENVSACGAGPRLIPVCDAAMSCPSG